MAAFPNPLAAQSPPPASRRATLSLRSHGWTDTGALVLGVRVRGGTSGTNLGGMKGNEMSEELLPFSMGSGTLLDRNNNAILHALNALPTKPFFGAMTGIIRLGPGDTVVFGVAFPRPSEPPKDKNGRPTDFRLILTVPDMEPLDFIIPYHPPPVPPLQ